MPIFGIASFWKRSAGNILYKLLHKRQSFAQILGFAKRYVNYTLSSSGESLAPLRIFINLNNRCNARCRQCDVGLQNEKSMFFQTMIQNGSNELAIEKLEEIFSELSGDKPLIAFNGVEPTLYKELIRAVRSAKGHGMPVQITTNGILLPKIAGELFDAGLDDLWVSLDGPPNLHDEIRGVPGGFEKAMEGLRAIQKLKRDNETKRPSLNVVTTIFHANQSSIYDLMKLLAKSGVELDEVMIQHLQYVTQPLAKTHNSKFAEYPVTAISTEESDPALVDLEKLHEEIQRVEAGGFGLNIRWKPYLASMGELEDYYRRPEKFVGTSQCRVFWTEIQLLADGSLTGSQRCFPLNLGNVNEAPFGELWNSDEMKKWRRLLRKEGALPACTRCCSIL